MKQLEDLWQRSWGVSLRRPAAEKRASERHDDISDNVRFSGVRA
jgi:hypothetical protein